MAINAKLNNCSMQITNAKSLQATLLFALFLMQIYHNWQRSQVLVGLPHPLHIYGTSGGVPVCQHNILIGICISSSMQLPTLFSHISHLWLSGLSHKRLNMLHSCVAVAITRPYITVVCSAYVCVYNTYTHTLSYCRL